MKKLTAGIFATLLTVVTVGVANADIASTAWVNSKIGEVNTGVEGVDSKIEGVQQTVNSQAADIAELEGQVVGLASEVETFDTALSAAEGKITTAEGKITTLETDGGKKLDSTTASNTYATKTALDSKLNKNLGAGSSGNILTVGSDGAITSSATIAQGKVNGLTTTLAGKANASDLTALEQTVEGKADASALTALETEVEDKQDKLSAAQLGAVNSGITASKVSTYDGYDSKITTATNTANAAKSAAETATSTASAAKTAAEAATEAAQNAASSASDAVTSANKAIPKPADDKIDSEGVFVLTYNATNKEYAWERITR